VKCEQLLASASASSSSASASSTLQRARCEGEKECVMLWLVRLDALARSSAACCPARAQASRDRPHTHPSSLPQPSRKSSFKLLLINGRPSR
jgi:hypothetical protein